MAPRKPKVVDPTPETRTGVLKFHLSSREEVKISLGELDEQQLMSVNNTISTAFSTLRQTDDFLITDDKGTTYHFNVDHVTHVEVHVQ